MNPDWSDWKLNEREEITLPYRRIPNDVYSYYSLKEMEHNSSLLSMGYAFSLASK